MNNSNTNKFNIGKSNSTNKLSNISLKNVLRNPLSNPSDIPMHNTKENLIILNDRDTVNNQSFAALNNLITFNNLNTLAMECTNKRNKNVFVIDVETWLGQENIHRKIIELMQMIAVIDVGREDIGREIVNNHSIKVMIDVIVVEGLVTKYCSVHPYLEKDKKCITQNKKH